MTSPRLMSVSSFSLAFLFFDTPEVSVVPSSDLASTTAQAKALAFLSADFLALASQKPSICTKNIGTSATAKTVEAIMPLNTVKPIEILEAAPAPEDVNSGTTPRIKAIEVITIGLKRSCEAFRAASIRLSP